MYFFSKTLKLGYGSAWMSGAVAPFTPCTALHPCTNFWQYHECQR